MTYEKRYEHIHIEIKKPMLHTFEMLVQNDFECEWKNRNGQRVFKVYGKLLYEFIFVLHNEGFYLIIEDLWIRDERLGMIVDAFLNEAKKRQANKSITLHPVQKEEQVDTNFRKRFIEGLNVHVNEKIQEHVRRMEIDYVLMELYEAMQEENEEEITRCKTQLATWTNERKDKWSFLRKQG